MKPAMNGLVNRLVPTASPVVVVSTTPDPVPHSPFAGPVVVCLLLMLGIGLRTAAFVSDRCLWVDEAMLALNLVAKSPAELLKPLDYNQGAPVGFLMLSRLSIELFGTSEQSLRLVSFIGSLAGLFGFAYLTRRFLSPPAAVLALGMMSVSPFLISYASECKQYSTDAAIGIGLFAAAAGLLLGESGFRRWAILAVAGAIAVWFSHPSAFVLGGIGSALLLGALYDRDRERFLAAGATVGCWLVSFALVYFVNLRQLGSNQYLLDFWVDHFMPMPRSVEAIAWLVDHFFAAFSYPGGLGGTEIRAGGIAAVFFVVGIASLARYHWTVALALIVPGLLALAASALHKYPFAGRLLLFLVPLVLLGVAEGAWCVCSALKSGQPLAMVLFLGILICAPALEAYQELRRPKRHEDIAPVLADLHTRWQECDRMHVYYGGYPSFLFYSRTNPFPVEAITHGTESRSDKIKYRDELLPLRGSPRVWLVFSHRHNNEESLIRAYAEGMMARCITRIEAPGAAAYLYDFSACPK